MEPKRDNYSSKFSNHLGRVYKIMLKTKFSTCAVIIRTRMAKCSRIYRVDCGKNRSKYIKTWFNQICNQLKSSKRGRAIKSSYLKPSSVRSMQVALLTCSTKSSSVNAVSFLISSKENNYTKLKSKRTSKKVKTQIMGKNRLKYSTNR